MFNPQNNYSSPLEDWKMKYESCFLDAETSELIPQTKLTKKSKKSKVKQIVSMFNSKMSHFVKSDVENYHSLHSEFSPDAKQQPPKRVIKPVPLNRKYLPKPKTPQPTRGKFSKSKENLSACLVPEAVFAKLSVKEKAQLYTQFVEEMTIRNPKFGLMTAADHSLTNRNGVVVEKQGRVKELLEELQLKSVFSKPTPSQASIIQRMDSMKKACATRKNRQFPSFSSKQVVKEPKSQRETSSLRISNTETQSPSCNVQRKTDSNSQHQQIENLFFSWFKEKQENVIHSNEKSQKSTIDELLAKTIAKLENTEAKQKNEISKPMPRKKSSTNSKEILTTTTSSKPSESEGNESGVWSLPKNSSEDSQPESQGFQTENSEFELEFSNSLQSLRKKKFRKNSMCKKEVSVAENISTTSTDSEKDLATAEINLSNKNFFLKTCATEPTTLPTEPLMKSVNSPLNTKSAYTLTFNDLATPFCTPRPSLQPSTKLISQTLNDQAVGAPIESPLHKDVTQQQVSDNSSAVSSPRNKKCNISEFSTVNKSQEQQNLGTNVTNFKVSNEEETSQASITLPPKVCHPFETFNIVIETPNKESPEINLTGTFKKVSTQEEVAKTSLTLSKTVNCSGDQTKDHERQVFETALGSPLINASEQKVADQAHLTASSSSNSTRSNIKNREQQLFETAFDSSFNRTSDASAVINCNRDSFGCSTPNQPQERHSFSGKALAKRLFSPIPKPVKNRRKSFYGTDPKRNSLLMQVIEEDQPFEPAITQPRKSEAVPNSAANQEDFKQTTELPADGTSHFWIKFGGFYVGLQINNIEKLRLRLFYEIFSQASCDAKELHFGIDKNVFSVHTPIDMANISIRTPARTAGCSHYWVSTGDLTLPFSGPYMNPQKTESLFRFIKETVAETGQLQFGVDDTVFSNVSKFWHQPPKFSVESQYSMLVGLYSGESNGLEGRSSWDWPHSKPVRVTDLDQSDNESDAIGGRLSLPPFSVNYLDLAALGKEELSMPRNSLAMSNLESFCGTYDNEPLDELFAARKMQKQLEEQKQNKTMSVSEMICALKTQKQRLSGVQEKISNSLNPFHISKDCLDVYKGTPEYAKKLKSIVTDISRIFSTDRFKSCKPDELDTYMYFLSHYAEISLTSCKQHMETLLDALTDYKAVIV